MNQTAAPAVEIRGLTKTFQTPGQDPVGAVRGLDLTIQPGEIVALLGPNGAGKTTTLDTVLGLTEPTSGTVEVLGMPPRAAIAAGRVSAVLQSGGLLRDLTVRETVEVIASTYTHPRPVDEVLHQAAIQDISRRKISKCSGGEQQRVRFALALLPDPDVLILDEPTAGMDVQSRHDFWDRMHADAAAGRTVIFATHYLEEADAFARRIVMVAAGQVVADGSTEELRAKASGRTVSADLPPGDAEALTERLRHEPAIHRVALRGHRITLTAADSDAVALHLLRDLGALNLEVVSGSLESAFLAITGTDQTHQETSR
ncbi:ABC transporter ATP-binding protein [Demetria terragena]|uniref:ABC transporter ATP-binding protein n=1 Tax=Demetria terragena TaxID=63959 RepID=UPI0003698212|nr:ABC transporter ATP-binding protein [Demetria terragena]